jgi:putative ABC transport system permease protein
MFKLSFRDLRSHMGRYILTFVAVAIGVAFIGGILTLTDSMTRTFDDLFSDINEGTDAWVRGEGAFETGFEGGGTEMRPRIDASLVDEVTSVDGVAEAEGSVTGYARLIDKEGEPYGDPAFGAPTFGGSWNEIDDLNPFNLVEGSRAPENSGEIVLDKATADATDYAVGDTARFETSTGTGEAEVVGIAKFGTADGPLGASFVLFDLATAEELVAEPGKVDGIGVVADDGVSQTEVRDRIADTLSGEDVAVEVITGDELTDENQDQLSTQFGFIRNFLLAFGLIAVVVGGFVIFTSFSFIVAQRQRQTALIRAIGASRRQILWSVVIESLLVGIFASLLGYLLGVGLASLLATLMFADQTQLAILPTSLLTALLVGTLVTFLSAFVPAWRASKVPPVAAMRAVAVDTSGRSWIRIAIGTVALLLGVLALVSGLGDGGFQMIGVGIFFVFVALVVFGPAAARPTAAVLGRPLPWVKGIVGRLAQLNTGRNPKRTAYTASALMIGLGVVSLFLVLNASVRKSIDQIIDERFTGDYVVASEASMMGGGLPNQVADDINALPDVDVAAGIRFGLAEVDGSATGISGVDPERAFDLFDVGVTAGNADDLNDGGIATTVDKAEDEGWQVGDEIEVTFAETGPQQVPLVALIDDDQLTGTFVVGTQLFEDNVPNSGDALILVRLADGVSVAEARPELQGVVDQFASAELQDLDEYKEANKAPFDQILIMMGALLALTIIIAMVGIVNTLVLSVVERTQEIGLTRAVGASRRQIRSAIRWEALLIAAFGLMAALTVGIVFGWVVVEALKDDGFSEFVVPIGALVTVTLVTGALTLLAAVFPAAWAARRPILSAIAEH